jgi:hypothetical protein
VLTGSTTGIDLRQARPPPAPGAMAIVRLIWRLKKIMKPLPVRWDEQLKILKIDRA